MSYKVFTPLTTEDNLFISYVSFLMDSRLNG